MGSIDVGFSFRGQVSCAEFLFRFGVGGCFSLALVLASFSSDLGSKMRGAAYSGVCCVERWCRVRLRGGGGGRVYFGFCRGDLWFLCGEDRSAELVDCVCAGWW